MKGVKDTLAPSGNSREGISRPENTGKGLNAAALYARNNPAMKQQPRHGEDL